MMTTSIHLERLGLNRQALRRAAVLLGIVLVPWAGCGDQPKTNCLTSTAPFAMRLIEKLRVESIPGACAPFGPAAFNDDPEVGFSSYYPRDSKGQPDYAKGSLAIQTAEIGNLVFPAEKAGILNTAPDGKRLSLGAYGVTEPNDKNMCPVPTLTPTHVALAAIPAVPDDLATPDSDESVPRQPAVDIKLVWSNVLVYVTAASFGTQVQAELLDTRAAEDGSTCAIQYRAVALAPAVACAMLDTDGNPVVNADGIKALDPTLCDPEANPGLGRFIGSGISPNTSFTCDAATAFCLLTGDSIPALK